MRQLNFYIRFNHKSIQKTNVSPTKYLYSRITDTFIVQKVSLTVHAYSCVLISLVVTNLHRCNIMNTI